MIIALGSDRAAKIMAVRAAVARVASVDARWNEATITARSVETNVPAMPVTDWELMHGARARAENVRAQLEKEGLSAQVYVGLEGGFHSLSVGDEWHTFLRGWAYATDGERGYFGAGPSVTVPTSIADMVIDEVANERDVRSRQGAWGVLSRDLLTRSMSFESALIAAFAPFYNPGLYR
ncbi:MAG TPA: inosine/xanthosine triphosphatase [Pyrinomonadaceae bacterium]|nr:inosine/xanthosine triphosphatase [Pyrinomonadaceae bacterium]